MPVSATNLIQGPAVLYVGNFGTAEPATVGAAPAAAWVDVGGTKDGVELVIADEFATLTVDQLIYEVHRRRTARAVSIKTSLAEATLANLAISINNTAPVGNVLTADDGLAAFAPTYSALLLDGIAPGGFRRRIVLRKTMAVDSTSIAYKKDDQTVVPVTWMLHWVSPTIAPFRIEDATA